MAVETEVRHVPLSKSRLLEYLERQQEPVTAKAVSIDLDCHAGTAHEMMERCAGQGLVECDRSKRPREFRINEAGRERLKFFHSSQGNPQSQSADRREETDPRSDDEPQQPGPVSVSDALAEVKQQREAMHEDFRDLFPLLGLQPSPGEGVRERVERIQKRLAEVAGQAEADVQSEVVVRLYCAKCELGILESEWFRSEQKEKLRKQIADLEAEVGKKTAERVERLVSLEWDLLGGDGERKDLREVLRLREQLHLPASVCGRAQKSAEGETAEA